MGGRCGDTWEKVVEFPILASWRQNGGRGALQLRHLRPARIGPPMGLPGDQLRGWHRSCNAVTLGKFATELQQRFTVGHGFHPFGDHQAAERGCQTEHAVDDGQVVGVAEHVADEALVDLEDSSGQALETLRLIIRSGEQEVQL